MEVDKFEHGVPGWVDLGTPDLDAARAFYSALFGWDIPPGPEEAGGYSVAMMRGRATAGFGPSMNPGPPTWSTYVIVDSADDIAKKVADAGGMAFVEPMDVLDAGRMAVFADPRGAVFSVWQPNQMPGAGIVNEPNSYSWSELLDVRRRRVEGLLRQGLRLGRGHPAGRACRHLHRVEGWRPIGRRHDAASADAPSRSARPLGGVLLGGGHQRRDRRR